MGAYMVSSKEIIERLTDCLDNIEGDFSSYELVEALDFMMYYAPTSDNSKHFEKIWHKKLKSLYEVKK